MPFVSFSVENNAFRGAGTFELTLAISALPPDMQLLNWWAVQTTIRTELFISIVTQTGVNEKRHITGSIDTWHYEPARFEISAEGRDFTAKLIDAKTPGESFKNLTSSQIVTTLAQRHGLTPVVTATTQRVGEYYQIDSTHLTGEQTEWDLITSLAGIENIRFMWKVTACISNPDATLPVMTIMLSAGSLPVSRRIPAAMSPMT